MTYHDTLDTKLLCNLCYQASQTQQLCYLCHGFRAWFTVEKIWFGVAGKETTIGILQSSSLVMKRKRLLISH